MYGDVIHHQGELTAGNVYTHTNKPKIYEHQPNMLLVLRVPPKQL